MDLAIIIALAAGVLFGAVLMAFGVAGWLAAQKHAFLGSSRAVTEAHARLGLRVAELKERKKPRRIFGKKRSRA